MGASVVRPFIDNGGRDPAGRRLFNKSTLVGGNKKKRRRDDGEACQNLDVDGKPFVDPDDTVTVMLGSRAYCFKKETVLRQLTSGVHRVSYTKKDAGEDEHHYYERAARGTAGEVTLFELW